MNMTFRKMVLMIVLFGISTSYMTYIIVDSYYKYLMEYPEHYKYRSEINVIYAMEQSNIERLEKQRHDFEESRNFCTHVLKISYNAKINDMAKFEIVKLNKEISNVNKSIQISVQKKKDIIYMEKSQKPPSFTKWVFLKIFNNSNIPTY
jgi:hypothetical protein